MLFAISGLICWCGISQVISNSVVSSFKNAFSIPPVYTTVVLVAVAAVIVLRKNATVKILDMIVPVMAVVYFAITILVIVMNIGSIPGVFARIFQEAFGFRQVAAGGFGAVLMNGVKRGLFPMRQALVLLRVRQLRQNVISRSKQDWYRHLGIIRYDRNLQLYCNDHASCPGRKMLQDFPEWIFCRRRWNIISEDLVWFLLQRHYFSFSFSTFLGILFYARSNVAYLFRR